MQKVMLQNPTLLPLTVTFDIILFERQINYLNIICILCTSPSLNVY